MIRLRRPPRRLRWSLLRTVYASDYRVAQSHGSCRWTLDNRRLLLLRIRYKSESVLSPLFEWRIRRVLRRARTALLRGPAAIKPERVRDVVWITASIKPSGAGVRRDCVYRGSGPGAATLRQRLPGSAAP